MTRVRFQLDDVRNDGQVLTTTCGLTVLIDDAVIWPTPVASGGLEIQIDDLLSHLAEVWKPLLLRQTYPLTLNPLRPQTLEFEASRRWEAMPEEEVENEELTLASFQQVHDLSQSFGGLFEISPLWFVRSGSTFQIDNGAKVYRVPFNDAHKALVEIGDAIASRLERTGSDRWVDLIKLWNGRTSGKAEALLAWSTSLPLQTATSLTQNGLLTLPQSFDDVAQDNDELRIAARMAGALPYDEIALIIRRMKQFSRTDAPLLRDLRDKLRHSAESNPLSRAFEQGVMAANFVRSELRVQPDERVDVEQAMKSLGITVELEKLENGALDALAVWGPHRGPAVLLNNASDRHLHTLTRLPGTRGSRQVRVTLAHELCHLLLDADHAVSAVDVLHSRMPEHIEQRARAFAGEFLLPAKAAGTIWRNAGSPLSGYKLKKLVTELSRQFTITMSVASWKLQHGAKEYDQDLRRALDLMFPDR